MVRGGGGNGVTQSFAWKDIENQRTLSKDVLEFLNKNSLTNSSAPSTIKIHS